MREGNITTINTNFSLNVSLRTFVLRNFFGLNKKSIMILESRFEIFSSKALNEYDFEYWSVLSFFLFDIIPFRKKLDKKKLANIFFLDLISSYRGWRHLRGLPVRGQRTWSNAWSVYRSNLSLRHYKIFLLKKIYSQASLRDLNLAYAAEQFNILWKLQWEDEWKLAKKKRSSFMKKKHGVLKVNLAMMARGQINEQKSGANKGKQKSKNTGVFNMGFDPGFTKTLLRTTIKSKIKKKTKTNGEVVNKPQNVDAAETV